MNDESATTRSRLRWIGLVAGPVLAAAVYALLPRSFTDSAGATVEFAHSGRATLGLMVWMAAWWLTEAIDIAATALLPVALMPLVGAATMKQAAAPYASDLIFLFAGGFGLALSMQRWGLDKRIALVTLRLFGTRPAGMIGGCMLATALISAFVSNTATAAMMLPIGLGVIGLVRSRHRSADAGHAGHAGGADPVANFAVCMMLGIAYASTIGGLATIIGTPPNAYLVGFIRDDIDPAYQQAISFARWFAIGVPLAAVFLPITWLVLTRVIYPVGAEPIEGGREFVQSGLAQLGPMKRGEWATMIVFFVAAVAWIVRPLLVKVSFGAGTGSFLPLAGLTDSGIAVVAALVLFVIPVDLRQRRFVMDWQELKKLPWGVLILFGGGLSLAAAIELNGVDQYLGSLAGGLHGWPPLLLVIIVVAAVVFFSELASNTATATSLVPILAAIAPALGVHPFLLIIPAALAASCAFMLPAGTPPNAMVFGTGHVTMPQMIKAGFWLNLIGIALITALTYAVIVPLLVR